MRICKQVDGKTISLEHGQMIFKLKKKDKLNDVSSNTGDLLVHPFLNSWGNGVHIV